MAKTTIRLNDDEWDIVLEALEAFDEIEVVSVKNAIGKKVYPDDPDYRSRIKIRQLVSEDRPDSDFEFSEYLT